MHMQVDKAGGDDATWQVLHGYAGVLIFHRGIRPCGLHHLLTPGIWPDHQQTVLFKNCGLGRLAVRGETQDGGAVGFHGRHP